MSKTSKQLSDNLRMLMGLFDYTPKILAKKSGVTDRMITYILNNQRVPSIDVADKLAKPFGLNGWQLLLPSLPKDIKQNKSIRSLIDNYLNASDAGKEIIVLISGRENKTANSS